MYDFLIAGSGIFGSTLAYILHKSGKKVLILEQRDHTGGNCHSYQDNGIETHKYGPHIFHTSDTEIWKFVASLCPMMQYCHRVKAIANNAVYSFPINLLTLHQLFNVTTPAEAEQVISSVRVPITTPRNMEEYYLSVLGKRLYELFFYGYTKKQWGREPSNLPVSIAQRTPFRLTFNDNYFTSTYQGIPVNGYSELFDKLLDGCEVILRHHATPNDLKLARHTIFSGRIDEFFGYKYGQLQYRSLKLDYQRLPTTYQGMPVSNHTDISTPYTRTTEYKFFGQQQVGHTIISFEQPFECEKDDIPYYPIIDETNVALYKKYLSIRGDVVFSGRTGSFSYLDMDQTIKLAFTVSKKLPLG